MKRIMMLAIVLVLFTISIVSAEVKGYKYAIIDSNGLIVGYQVLQKELTIIPANMRFMAEISNDDLIGKKKWDSVKLIFVDYTDKRILSKYEFNERFTFDELVAITEAAKTNSRIAVFKNKFEISQEVNLDLPSVSQGLDLLVQAGLLKQDRKAEILK